MRLTLIAFLLLTGAAHAKECKPPKLEDEQISGLRTFAECLIEEVADLKRGQAELRSEIDKLQKTLATVVPGALTNDNGRVTRTGGENLVEANFSLATRTRQGASALDIDQKALEEICESSCTFTLVLTGIGLRASDPAPVFATGPCVFGYSAGSGVWSRSGACGDTVTGIDGNGTPTAALGGEIIAEAGGGCILADSEPRRDVDPETEALGRDRKRGLFLIADAALWKGDGGRFQCDLRFSR
jgi:hypothetical protein